MIPYRKEKIDNAICFFATKHRDRFGHNPSQMSIYKYLAFFEFQAIERYGEPPLGLVYKAMRMGPVPVEIYNKEIHGEKYSFDSYYKNLPRGEKIECYTVEARGEPDLDYFSEDEQALMDEVVRTYGGPAEVMSKKSHEIRAWKKAAINSLIRYEDMFDNFEDNTEDNPAKSVLYGYLQALNRDNHCVPR